MYSIEIVIESDLLNDPIEVTLKDKDIISLKKDIIPTVELICYFHNI